MYINQILRKRLGREKAKTVVSQKSNAPRVKLVAIAKDEAAYIPDWVHHHQYFGFDSIEIYINRTSDNSLEVIQALKKIVPNLDCSIADWIDTCPAEVKNYLQFIIYAKAFEQEKQAGEFDYLMFLDIDEFWTPSNMRSSVQYVINQNSDAKAISFGWFNEHGQDSDFQPIQHSSMGQLSPLVKTIIRLDADISEIALHQPQLLDGKVVMADGDSFISSAENKECVHQDLVKIRQVMIVHRMFRSPMEYISLLSRGRPSDSLALKLNRGGYNKASGTHARYELDDDGYQSYMKSRDRCFEDSDIHGLMLESRRFVTERYETALNSVIELPIENFINLFDIFKGCNRQVIENIVNTISLSPNIHTCADRETLMSLAKSVHRYNSKLSNELYAMAMELE